MRTCAQERVCTLRSFVVCILLWTERRNDAILFECIRSSQMVIKSRFKLPVVGVTVSRSKHSLTLSFTRSLFLLRFGWVNERQAHTFRLFCYKSKTQLFDAAMTEMNFVCTCSSCLSLVFIDSNALSDNDLIEKWTKNNANSFATCTRIIFNHRAPVTICRLLSSFELFFWFVLHSSLETVFHAWEMVVIRCWSFEFVCFVSKNHTHAAADTFRSMRTTKSSFARTQFDLLCVRQLSIIFPAFTVLLSVLFVRCEIRSFHPNAVCQF